MLPRDPHPPSAMRLVPPLPHCGRGLRLRRRRLVPSCRHAARRFRPSARPLRLFAVGRARSRSRSWWRCAKRHAMPAVAITDSGNLFGALEFATPAPKRASSRSSAASWRCAAATATRRLAGNGHGHGAEPDRIVLLVQNEAGYRNLLRSSASPFSRRGRRRAAGVAGRARRRRATGCICLTGGAARPGRAAARRGPGRGGRGDAARALKDALPRPALYRADAPRPRPRRPHRSGRSSTSPTRTICRSSPPTTPISPTAISTRRMTRCCASPQGTRGRRRRPPPPDAASIIFRSAAEMRALFADLPEACDNTLVIARRCAFMPEARKPILPAFPLPEARRRPTDERERPARGGAGRARRAAAPPRASRERERRPRPTASGSTSSST